MINEGSGSKFLRCYWPNSGYFTPKQEDAQIGGNKDVPTLNIIGALALEDLFSRFQLLRSVCL